MPFVPIWACNERIQDSNSNHLWEQASHIHASGTKAHFIYSRIKHEAQN